MLTRRASITASFINKCITQNTCKELRKHKYSSEAKIYNDKDPAPYFLDRRVQKILKSITDLDFEKLSRRRLDERKLLDPMYQFVTDEQLGKIMSKAHRKARKLIQMPPVVKVRKPVDEVLSTDPVLDGFSSEKYIFTDITQDVSDRKRFIVVRDTDGTLRHATWEERHRMNQIYNPVEGRKITMPKLFQEDHLKDSFSRQEYMYVLDKASIQFDADDPDYQRVVCTTFEEIEKEKAYDVLFSTRYFGPFCFYLVWQKNIDSLLVDLINRKRAEAAASIVQIFYIIHAEDKYREITSSDAALDLLQDYAEHEEGLHLELKESLQKYQELLRQEREYHKKVQEAHGLVS